MFAHLTPRSAADQAKRDAQTKSPEYVAAEKAYDAAVMEFDAAFEANDATRYEKARQAVLFAERQLNATRR